MKRLPILLLAAALAAPSWGQTPPPPVEKKAEPAKPEKAEQEPRPVQQELQKQQSQKKDAPAPAAAAGGQTPPQAVDEKKEAKWDVMNPISPARHDATIDTTEGTWLSVDVSPDGREIAFDLLGDIYTIPITGGEAKALTTGIAWDMQPRYSPNGKWIAFTSDRAGGGNIWIMNRDGSDPKQVTKETVRLLNEPDWSPDSEVIVARQNLTSHRAQTLPPRPLPRRGRDVALSPHRRRRTAADQETHGAERHRRAGVLARRPLPLLQRRHHVRRPLPVQQRSERAD